MCSSASRRFRPRPSARGRRRTGARRGRARGDRPTASRARRWTAMPACGRRTRPLPVVARVAAGRPGVALEAGEAMGIATGGLSRTARTPRPGRASAEEDGSVNVPDTAAARRPCPPRGRGDVRAGEVVPPAGTCSSPRAYAPAAAGSRPVVRGSAPVAIVTTGTELRRPGEPLADGEIYESNGVMLAATLTRAGAVVVGRETGRRRGVAPRRASSGARRGHARELGGVSVGAHDLVQDAGGTRARRSSGESDAAWKAPVVRGARAHARVRAPGNPVSSLVGAPLRPARAACPPGASDPAPRSRPDPGEPSRRHPGRDDYQRAAGRDGLPGTVLRPIEGQESHMIVRAADALVHVPRGEGTPRRLGRALPLARAPA